MFLRQQWKALSKPDKAHYKANGIQRRNRARSPYNRAFVLQPTSLVFFTVSFTGLLYTVYVVAGAISKVPWY